jgi:hypothetical protein
MSNINKNDEKTSKVKLLKIPEVTCFLRNGTATIRLKLRGADTKISLGVKAKQGCIIDPSTGQIDGDADATSIVLPMIERSKNALRQSFILGKEPTLDWLKKEIFGVSNVEQIPSLTVVLKNYFALYYGEKSEMDKKTKEKKWVQFTVYYGLVSRGVWQ